MSVTVKLPEELVAEARRHGEAYKRSVPKQIEYWLRIGKIAEENPDLSFEFIKDILLGIAQVQEGQLTPYKFD